MLLRTSIVRATRVRMIHIQNDHKEVMKYLEKGLHAHFAQLQKAQATATTNGTTVPITAPSTALENSTTDAAALGTPFAKVNSVESGSPANQAGLKAGDLVRAFGSVHWLNHERLSKVAEVVQQNEGVCSIYFDLIHCCMGHQANEYQCIATSGDQGIAQGGGWIPDYRGGAAAHSPT